MWPPAPGQAAQPRLVRRAAAAHLLALTAALRIAAVAAQPRRLRIRNGCGSQTIWIANQVNGGIGPDQQNLRIESNGFHDFVTLDGFSSTRYWPKMGCDGAGNHCSLGGSGGPGEACVGPNNDYSKCAPPVDTKFEATFGNSNLPCDPRAGQTGGCDHLDISLVDGYTLPFKLEAKGRCLKEDMQFADGRIIDCSSLSISQCPAGERIGDKVVDLKVTSPITKQVVGCYSPCTKLVDEKYNNTEAHGRKATDGEVAPYCCPTPPMTPEACRAGVGSRTAYVNAVHHMCPGVYGFAYDYSIGLVRCDARATYEVTFFCPQGTPPPSAPPSFSTPGTSMAISTAVVPGVDALPSQQASATGATGCDALCTTEGDGARRTFTCAYRMKWAATHRFAQQAQACSLAQVFVLVNCGHSCDGCSLEQSGCVDFLAGGQMLLGSDPDGPIIPGGAIATSVPVGFTTPRSHADPLSKSAPYIVAGCSSIIILVALAISLSGPCLGRLLPAAAAAKSPNRSRSGDIPAMARTVSSPRASDGLWSSASSPQGRSPTVASSAYSSQFRYEAFDAEDGRYSDSSPRSASRSPSRRRGWLGL